MFFKSIVSRVARVPAATRPAVVFARSFALSAPSKADDKKPLTEKLGASLDYDNLLLSPMLVIPELRSASSRSI
jgi:hypothetical protein